MLTKWFFQKEFCEYDLVQIGASVCSLDYPRISSTAENRVVTIYYLHPGFFQNSTWAHAQQSAYEPITNILNLNLKFYTKGSSTPFTPKYPQQQTTTQGPYYASIHHDEGWFSTKILQAIKVTTPTGEERLPLPLAAARYNPAEDNGKGNEIWLASITGDTYHKPTDPILIFDNTPLWLAFWGYTNFIQKVKDKSLFSLSMFVIKSPYIKPGPTAQTQNYFPFVDLNFTLGRNPNNSYLTYADKKLWYPTVFRQLETINQIVECGPYVPKLGQTRESTWELPYKYNFFLSGVDPYSMTKKLQIQKAKTSILHPIQCKRQYRYPTPNIKTQTQFSMSGIIDEDSLQTKLYKECQKTSSLIQMSRQMQRAHKKRERELLQSSETQRKRSKKSRDVSSRSAKKVHAKKRRHRRQTSSSSSSSKSSSSSDSSTTS